jgi:hypothetical protein
LVHPQFFGRVLLEAGTTYYPFTSTRVHSLFLIGSYEGVVSSSCFL